MNKIYTTENDDIILMRNLVDDKSVAATVVDIRWDMITLYLDVRVEFSDKFRSQSRPQLPVFYAVNGAYRAKAVFELESVDGNIYRLSLNVTNAGNARCVPTGNYSLVVCCGDDILAVAETDVSLASKLADCSRSFLYSGKGRKKIYAVTFLIKEWTETLPFIMHILHARSVGMGDIYAVRRKPTRKMKMNKSKAKRRRFVFNLLQKMYNHYHKRYRRSTLSGKQKTILFLYEESYNMASNLKAVEKRLRQRELDNKFNIVETAWFPDAPSRYGLFERFEHQRDLMEKIAKADVIFVDCYVPAFTRVKLDLDNTTIINLWHAGIGFKTVGYSRWGHLGASQPFLGHRVYTYGICGSKKTSHAFSDAWGINDERVLPTGMPRMDKYLDKNHREEKISELYEQYPMLRNKKVILFAPTFRGSNRPDAHYPYDIIDFDKLYSLCGNEYAVLFKMHPWIDDPVPIENYGDRFIDVTSYPDINNLFYITDLLITDYSSCIYEFSLMRKPMLFFAFDEMQYSISRGFHHDYRLAAPGKVCNTFDELIAAIKNKDFDFEKVEQYVSRNFDVIDSNSSDRVIDWFLLGKMPEEYKCKIKDREENFYRMQNFLDFSSLRPQPIDDGSAADLNENNTKYSENNASRRKKR